MRADEKPLPCLYGCDFAAAVPTRRRSIGQKHRQLEKVVLSSITYRHKFFYKMRHGGDMNKWRNTWNGLANANKSKFHR
ncbi:uncharacterized protein GLRG_10964, partial [Colletotrichum graminicola M1.001]